MPAKLPMPVALCFCEDLFREKTSGNFHMIRWFDSMPARSLPHSAPPFVVCLMLIAVEGSYRSRVVCLDPSDETTFATPNHSVYFQHAGQTVWASFRIRSDMPEPLDASLTR